MRELPNNKEAEQALLGSILLDPSKLDDVSMSSDAFFHRNHKTLFEEMEECRRNNKLFDAITLFNWLKSKNKLDSIGGQGYLIDLQDSAIIPDNIKHYQEIVEDKHKKRKVIELSQNAINDVYNGEYSHSDHLGSLFSIDREKAKETPIEDICNEWLDRCLDGTVGHLPQWCQEWTDSLGKLESDLIILLAPRSTGKTALMVQWMTEIHKQGLKSPLCSIEMLKKPLSTRFICHIGKVNTFKMKVARQAITQQDIQRTKDSIEKIKSLNFEIVDGGMSIEDVFKYGIKQAKKGCDAIFIDNLLTISAGNKRFESKPMMYDYFIKRLKDLRDEIQIPVILLAHPNAEGGVAWSKDVENIADIIIFMANYPSGEDCLKIRGKNIYPIHDIAGEHVVVDFKKFRDGPTPIANLEFQKEVQTFKHIKWE